MKLAAALTVLAACSGPPHYLGAQMPQPCRAQDIDGCLGWMVERDLIAAELGVYEDARLRAYVQSVVDRLARGSLLRGAPRVLIADHDGTYATVGGRIVIARPTIEKLGSEAELAAIVAHEMAHIEGHHTVASLFGPHPGNEWVVMRHDAETIADERAVVLLERAGYAPSAMGRALRSVLTVADDEHGTPDERIAAVENIARGRAGFEGRAELLAHIDRMVVGRDTRFGRRVGDAWVIAALGVALELEDDDVVRADEELLVLRRERLTLTGYVIGAPWARELVAGLEGAEVGTSALGRVTAGTIPRHTRLDDSPLGKLKRAIRGTLPQPSGGARVAILERPRGALVLELGGHHVPAMRLREATAEEIAAAEPSRIEIHRATGAGTVASLSMCTGRLLDDPVRAVAAGDPIKCVDRTIVAEPARAPEMETRPAE